jgi:AcrR family transcriptional regulator
MRSERSSRGRTHDEQSKQTRVDVRERILCEATRLFGQRGFGGVALRDIAKACDIPLSTLSSHFARKRSLEEVVFQRAVEIIVKRDLSSRLAIGSPKQRFRRYLANVVELFLSDLPEMKLLDKEFQELDNPSTFDRLVRTSRERPAMESLMFVAELARDTRSDILKSIPAIELMQMVFAAIYGIVKLRSLHRHIIGGKPVSKAALTRDITLMFERTLHI